MLKAPDGSSSGVYRDKLKPLLDSTDAGHLLSIFSYTGEGACVEHVDRGFITLVTKSQQGGFVGDSFSALPCWAPQKDDDKTVTVTWGTPTQWLPTTVTEM